MGLVQGKDLFLEQVRNEASVREIYSQIKTEGYKIYWKTLNPPWVFWYLKG